MFTPEDRERQKKAKNYIKENKHLLIKITDSTKPKYNIYFQQRCVRHRVLNNKVKYCPFADDKSVQIAFDQESLKKKRKKHATYNQKRHVKKT